ncbi:hypothetical protein Hanom_Chr12g01150561 [Helianthus anomalus]
MLGIGWSLLDRLGLLRLCSERGRSPGITSVIVYLRFVFQFQSIFLLIRIGSLSVSRCVIPLWSCQHYCTHIVM